MRCHEFRAAENTRDWTRIGREWVDRQGECGAKEEGEESHNPDGKVMTSQVKGWKLRGETFNSIPSRGCSQMNGGFRKPKVIEDQEGYKDNPIN